VGDDLGALTCEQLLALLRPANLAGTARLTSPWMTPEEAAAYLGIALGTLRNWTSARFIPFSKRGRVVRYHRDAIDRWLGKGGCPGRTTIADLPG
jgi:excisionase family DNA binding protein